ncbi:putative glutamine ABC transporter permease protein GlnM [Hartmannibacter diazotrophicus]|uniref:Putative glutamine ABC transporter permease protein GlnM n=1 Tax=Hartmannibacter diazotrophicus TaxID=1482074 RepID=A0A2C9D9F6_9HYPH|nr:amino acid ABC transporter permease [Hartmannibacter diazotrophicus]SON56964.1 putative glutamine ABC transporter permease protein GlnM [Hartmannibacter diazotrophicus]
MNGFAIVWENRQELFAGFLNTVLLSISAAVISVILGVFVAAALMSRGRILPRLAGLYVDTMRCVPFLLFAYFIYFGLPSAGLRLTNWSSGLLALTLYNIAYMAELLRAAWKGLPSETIEAGRAFGFHGAGLIRRIILPPVFFSAVPMIGNQTIQIVKDSAFLTIITVAELTHAATSIQTTYFVPFASFVSAIFLYWILCMTIELGVAAVGHVAHARR